jgi:hypothetical protein
MDELLYESLKWIRGGFLKNKKKEAKGIPSASMTNPKGDPSEGSYLYLINAR